MKLGFRENNERHGLDIQSFEKWRSKSVAISVRVYTEQVSLSTCHILKNYLSQEQLLIIWKHSSSLLIM